MWQLLKRERMWSSRPLKDRYEVVIIGGGVHGLATAYYLGKLGVRDVAVLEKNYTGPQKACTSTTSQSGRRVDK